MKPSISTGPIFGGGVKLLQPATEVFERDGWIEFEVVRNGSRVSFLIDGKVIQVADDAGRTYDRVGLSPFRSTMHVSDISFVGALKEVPKPLPHVDVFIEGSEYPSFRIPSIVVSKQGTLLAFAEGRNKRSDHAANDIVLKRSTDGGKTWGKLILVAEDGGNSLNNPQAVVVPRTGRILMMYQRYPQGIHEGQVKPGHDGPNICRNFLGAQRRRRIDMEQAARHHHFDQTQGSCHQHRRRARHRHRARARQT